MFRFLILLLLIGETSFAADGARATLEAVYNDVPTFIDICLDTCKLSNRERELLSASRAGLTSEKPLSYISGKSRPDLFAPAGVHRMAVTGSKVGDPIYVNTDEIASVTFTSAIALLVHELGHHQGVPDTEDRVLDVLGAKVREAVEARMERSDLAAFGFPKISLILLQPRGIKVGAPLTSRLWLLSSEVVEELGIQFDSEFGCPVGLKRIGGILITQLQGEGAYDVEPGVAESDFGFRVETQTRCEGPGEKMIQYLSTRIVLPVSKSGVMGEPQLTLSDRGRTDVFQNLTGLPLKIVKLESTSKTLANGDVWKITAQIELPHDISAESCAGTFTSPSFVNYAAKPRVLLDFADCQMKSIGNDRYEVQLAYRFPQSTPSRDYVLRSVAVKLRNQDYSLEGAPAFEERVHLKSQIEPPPLRLAAVALTKAGANGQPEFLDPDIKLNTGAKYKLPAPDLFGFQLLIESTSPLQEKSLLMLLLAWNENGKDVGFEYPVPFGDSFKNGWHIPFGGGTQIVKDPMTANRFIFQTSLRGFASTGPAANRRLNVARFEACWFINENLQEVFKRMGVTVEMQ